MDLKEIENRFKEITGDYSLKLSKEKYYHEIYNMLDYIISTIVEINELERYGLSVSNQKFKTFKNINDITEIEENCSSLKGYVIGKYFQMFSVKEPKL